MTTASRNLTQRYPGKRAFITGAASGLGLACAEILAREGWRLILTDIDAPRLDLVAQSMRNDGAAVAAMACDVRDQPAIRALIEQTASAAGGIDLAIHAAGVVVAGPFHSGSAEDWQWVFDINVHGVANSCRAVIPVMAKSGGGLIINIASAASFCTGSNMAAYNSAKAAVVALSETLMQEYAANGIRVLVAMPGFFRTRLMESARGAPKTLDAARRIMTDSNLEADAVAEAMLQAAARGRTHWVYPERYAYLWRLKRLMPQQFQRLLPQILRRR